MGNEAEYAAHCVAAIDLARTMRSPGGGTMRSRFRNPATRHVATGNAPTLVSAIQEFLALEAAAGVLLVAAGLAIRPTTPSRQPTRASCICRSRFPQPGRFTGPPLCWAIPPADDIAFALGVLSLLGDRVPRGLKLFLLTLAIIDDLGAIIVIALFYAGAPSVGALALAGTALVLLVVMNLRDVARISPYLLLGLVLWSAVLQSGVHATIAGVLLAFTIPLRTRDAANSPLRRLEQDLHTPVAFAILPLFAFANSGIDLGGMSMQMITHPIPLGIAAGLFVGKQAGVFLASALLIRSGLARLPEGVGWGALYGASLLCGIGFTMSLFVASLAFPDGAPSVDERIGIMLGSLLSAAAGYAVLRLGTRPAGAQR